MQLIKDILTFIFSMFREVKYIADAVYYHEVDLPKSYWRFTLLRPFFKYEDIPYSLKNNFCPLFWTTNVLLVLWIFAFVPYVVVKLLAKVFSQSYEIIDPYVHDWQDYRDIQKRERVVYKYTKVSGLTHDVFKHANFDMSASSLNQLLKLKLDAIADMNNSAAAFKLEIEIYIKLLLSYKYKNLFYQREGPSPLPDIWKVDSCVITSLALFLIEMLCKSKEEMDTFLKGINLTTVARALYVLSEERLSPEFWVSPQAENAIQIRTEFGEHCRKLELQKQAEERAQAEAAVPEPEDDDEPEDEEDEEEEENEDDGVLKIEGEEEEENEDAEDGENNNYPFLRDDIADAYMVFIAKYSEDSDPREILHHRLLILAGRLGIVRGEDGRFTMHSEVIPKILASGMTVDGSLDRYQCTLTVAYSAAIKEYFGDRFEITKHYQNKLDEEQAASWKASEIARKRKEYIEAANEAAKRREEMLKAKFKWLISLTPLIQKTAKIVMFVVAALAFLAVVFFLVPKLLSLVIVIGEFLFWFGAAFFAFVVEWFEFVAWADVGIGLGKFILFVLGIWAVSYFLNTVLLELTTVAIKVSPDRVKTSLNDFFDDNCPAVFKRNGFLRVIVVLATYFTNYIWRPFSWAGSIVGSFLYHVCVIIGMIAKFPFNVMKLFYKNNCPAIRVIDDKKSADNPTEEPGDKT